jgi:hypothetical protein
MSVVIIAVIVWPQLALWLPARLGYETGLVIFHFLTARRLFP